MGSLEWQNQNANLVLRNASDVKANCHPLIPFRGYFKCILESDKGHLKVEMTCFLGAHHRAFRHLLALGIIKHFPLEGRRLHQEEKLSISKIFCQAKCPRTPFKGEPNSTKGTDAENGIASLPAIAVGTLTLNKAKERKQETLGE